MSGIEIGLIITVGIITITMSIFAWWLCREYFRIKEEDTYRLNMSRDYKASVLDDIHKVREELKEVKLHLGFVDKKYPFQWFQRKPSKSVYERINLLMDHLNLEIKEGEPSKTILVKKKPIKKGK